MNQEPIYELILEKLPSDPGDLARLKTYLLINLEYSVEDALEILKSIPITIATSSSEEGLESMINDLSEINAECSVKKRVKSPQQTFKEELVLFDETELLEKENLILIDEQANLEDLLHEFIGAETEKYENVENSDIAKDCLISDTSDTKLELAEPSISDNKELEFRDSFDVNELADSQSYSNNANEIQNTHNLSYQDQFFAELTESSKIYEGEYEAPHVETTKSDIGDFQESSQSFNLKKRITNKPQTVTAIPTELNVKNISKTQNLIILSLTALAICLGFVNLFLFLNRENEIEQLEIPIYKTTTNLKSVSNHNQQNIDEKIQELEIDSHDSRGILKLYLKNLNKRTLLLELSLKDYPRISIDSSPTEVENNLGNFWIESLRMNSVVEVLPKVMLFDAFNSVGIGRMTLKDPRTIRRLPAKIDLSITSRRINLIIEAESFRDSRIFEIKEETQKKVKILFQQLSE